VGFNYLPGQSTLLQLLMIPGWAWNQRVPLYQCAKKELVMARDTDVAKERLINDFKAVIRDAEELLKATADQTGDKIDSVRARAKENIDNARQKLDELEDDVAARARAAYKATDQMVHDNPWQTAAVAAGVGLLLGLLLGRR
jgi:ElaB/YqjD/DUF883 family membrane-anchored ribosome-binding protein